MERADLLAYAQSQLTTLAAEAALTLADNAAGIAYQLDQALADLGADTANANAGYALIEYHTLRKLQSALAARVDFDATAVQRPRSQLFEHIKSLLKDASERAAAAGHPVTASATTGQSTTVRWTADWIEPEPII